MFYTDKTCFCRLGLLILPNSINVYMKYSTGLTVADLVFPWFMWIMGVSIVFSFRGRKDRGILKILYQIVRRTVILFGLGLFLNNGEQQYVHSHRQYMYLLNTNVSN